MGEFEFINDLCCNYLTIPYEGREEDFALRMMTEKYNGCLLRYGTSTTGRESFSLL